MTPGFRLLAIIVLLDGLAVPSLAQDSGGNPSGAYALVGETAAAVPYQGTIGIKARGQAFDVAWARDNNLAQHGFALRLDNVLGIGAEDGDPDFGVVLYHVKDGHLDGIWQGNLSLRVMSLGREVLDGPSGLEGLYQISLGLNPDGSHYHGEVTISRQGRVYLVDWRTPVQRYLGTGILLGDVFVVGYAEHRRSGVAAYCLHSMALIEGVTATADDNAYGAEVFWPQGDSAPQDAADRLAQLRAGGAAASCGAPIASLLDGSAVADPS